jgi:alpha-glucuronidase
MQSVAQSVSSNSVNASGGAKVYTQPNMKRNLLTLFLLTLFYSQTYAESGYRLWLRYDKITHQSLYSSYRGSIKQLIFPGKSDILNSARQEIRMGLKGLLLLDLRNTENVTANGALVIGTPASSKVIASLPLAGTLKSIGNEGYIIKSLTINGKPSTIIAANSDRGVLYGVFNFLRLLQAHQEISSLNISDSPKTSHRLLNHWDNLDRSVERGYAGLSLWDWAKLPDLTDSRYRDYARANASIGINGTVITNVNANAKILTKDYLLKAAALADIFRSYGLKVYLTARFSAPIEIGGLKTADPLDPEVQKWWKDKVNEIYRYIPDFGGFLVKANSEGQPGPQNYGRNHTDGANMFADALAPHGGIVMWRAFVYDNNVPDDRAKQAFTEFKPLDGTFRPNVIIQIKNGPIDFQPREPFSPLFGAMPKTPEMMEFQITMEYLGQSTHLVYMGTYFKETLDADTYSKGSGSTVAKVVSGQLDGHRLSGMAGVANIGTDSNWCGNIFNQANWFVYGRLAWNDELTAAGIADEWLKMTFTNEDSFVGPVKKMMMESRENTVNYMTPLGLHHIMGVGIHYGPGPWVANGGRADWNSTYYHNADTAGIGFNRSSTGSNAVAQYFSPLKEKFDNVKTTPEEYLLWFHHLPWTYKMKSGNTLWNELADHYYRGAAAVQQMQQTWNKMEGKVDQERFKAVKDMLVIQEREAKWWRDGCLLYFQTFSKMPIPAKYEKPAFDLATYMNPKFIPMKPIPVVPR